MSDFDYFTIRISIILPMYNYFGSKDDIEACSGLYNFIASLNNILTTRYLLFKGKML